MGAKIVAIVGQTASGKSDMAIDLAKKFNGEIICADSRTIYRGMDIGTAKPSKGDQAEVRHHLLNVVSPDEKFSAAKFKTLATQAISEIAGRNKIPILTGGTGLYINGVVYDFSFGGKEDPETRRELERLTDEQLQEKARRVGIDENEINFKNRRHLIRAVERGHVIKDDNSLRADCLLIGVDLSKDILKARIQDRLDNMINNGLEKEVRSLVSKYGFDAPGMNSICYREWQGYLAGEQTMDQLKQKMYNNTCQYARRQKTWFKRDENINWITSVDEASVLAQQFLIQ